MTDADNSCRPQDIDHSDCCTGYVVQIKSLKSDLSTTATRVIQLQEDKGRLQDQIQSLESQVKKYRDLISKNEKALRLIANHRYGDTPDGFRFMNDLAKETLKEIQKEMEIQNEKA